MSQLAHALFTTTRQRVLGLLYGHPDRSYYTNEIIRLTGMGVATIKRELDRMTAAEILVLCRQGNQRHYQANPDCLLFQELRGITRKTFGLADVLKKALEPLTDRIEWAFVFGSIASGKDSATSDIDLMLIGEIGFAEALAALHPVQASLQREINPRVYHPDEWRDLVDQNDAFVSEVLAKPRLEIMEKQNEFAESGWNQP